MTTLDPFGSASPLKQALYRELRALWETDVTVTWSGATSSPREKVYQNNHIKLYWYPSQQNGSQETKAYLPIIICYTLAHRPHILDLNPEQSLIKRLTDIGFDIYLIDWGSANISTRWTTLDDYIDIYMKSCLDKVCEHSGKTAFHLLGLCQGGIFALIYTALYPSAVQSLAVVATPIDFRFPPDPSDSQAPGIIYQWIKDIDVDLMVDSMGHIPGRFFNFGHLLHRPFSRSWGRYLQLADTIKNQENLHNSLRIEQWLFDTPDYPAEVFRKLAKDIYQNNRLLKAELKINQRRVDLSTISCPVLNVFGETDAFCPPSSSAPLKYAVASSDYTRIGLSTGHIGIYVSRSVRHALAERLGPWLKNRQ